MLDEAAELLKSGADLMIGTINTQSSPETLEVARKLPFLSEHGEGEFNLDLALRRKPAILIIDELASENPAGARNRKRYQDVEELLRAGINVYTTINIENIDSMSDIIEGITGRQGVERIPDTLFDQADRINIIDIEPDALLTRYKEQNYRAIPDDFLSIENLKLLREAALRKATLRVSAENRQETETPQKKANSRWLVCVGSSPSSAKCIRWTASAANAFQVEWIALHVDTARTSDRTADQKKGLSENLELAEKLGAETITLPGQDIAETVIAYAKYSGISNIVIGKSRRRRGLKGFFTLDFEDKLILGLPQAEIHMIPDRLPHQPYASEYFKEQASPFYFSWKDFLRMVLLVSAATVISYILHQVNLGEQNAIMIYILTVLLVSRVTAGYLYGVIASFLSVLVFNFFFTTPYFTFSSKEIGYPVTFLIMLVVALTTSALTVRIKAQVNQAIEREQRTTKLYEINQKLLAAGSLQEIVQLASESIAGIYERSTIFYLAGTDRLEEKGFYYTVNGEDTAVFKAAAEKEVADWVFRNQKEAGCGTDTFHGAHGFYLPVGSAQGIGAVIGLSCAKGKLSHENRLFLRLVSSQVALALERQRLWEDQQRILVESEKEITRSNLLRAISHDLRTPLTGILGASSVMTENDSQIEPATRKKLIENIRDDAQWLLRMVENLLSVTRINQGTANVTKTPEIVEEIIGVALSRIRKHFPERKILVNVTPDLLTVPMDGTLISQVLINLLENAIKHSSGDSEIKLTAVQEREWAVFEVADQGSGIPEDDLPYLFTSQLPDIPKRSDSNRGMGIGLSICMTIVKAHQGKMEAYNTETGGATFRFLLPMNNPKGEQS